MDTSRDNELHRYARDQNGEQTRASMYTTGSLDRTRSNKARRGRTAAAECSTLKRSKFTHATKIKRWREIIQKKNNYTPAGISPQGYIPSRHNHWCNQLRHQRKQTQLLYHRCSCSATAYTTTEIIPQPDVGSVWSLGKCVKMGHSRSCLFPLDHPWFAFLESKPNTRRVSLTRKPGGTS